MSSSAAGPSTATVSWTPASSISSVRRRSRSGSIASVCAVAENAVVRVAVHGTSGSGKTTAARAIAETIEAPLLELDAVRHQPGWAVLPDEDFRSLVADAAAAERWVIDGNYEVVRTVVDRRATHIVWLDLPRWLIMWRVTRRSVDRALFKRELWHGNREGFRDWLAPTHPVRWAWSTFDRRRAEYAAEMDGRWIRLRSRRQVRRWLAELRDVT